MNIALVYMASGLSRRFGSNKLLAELGNMPLYQHGFFHLQEAAQWMEEQEDSMSCRIYVVSSYGDILTWCQHHGAEAVFNGEAAEGIASSVRAGVKAAFDADGWAFFAADQPCLRGDTIAAFVLDCVHSSAYAGCAVSGTRKGSPAFFSHACKEKLLSLTGDVGGRTILRSSRQVRMFWVSEQELQDVDTPDVMEMVRKLKKYQKI